MGDVGDGVTLISGFQPDEQRAQWRILEKQVTKQGRDFFEYRGWRAIRMQSGMMASAGGSVVTIGEKGIPDFLFLHYLDKPAGACLYVWVEFKAPGKNLRTDQIKWHRAERLRGGMVWVIDNLEQLETIYYKVFAWLHQGDHAIGQTELHLR